MIVRARYRHRRRALAILAIVAALFTSVSAWLADTGVSTTSIAPPAGVAGDGKIASLTPLAVQFTRPQGNAQIVAGLALDRITVAAGFAPTLKIDMAWVNPSEADDVLNNPNAQIHVGVYYPIHTGACTSGVANSTADTRATITDDFGSGSVTICGALDTNATGSLTADGKMVLSQANVAGFLKVDASDPVGAAACGGSGSTWCRPAGVDGDTNVFYVGVTIVTPGGKPAGQQNNVSTLDFYTSIASA